MAEVVMCSHQRRRPDLCKVLGVLGHDLGGVILVYEWGPSATWRNAVNVQAWPWWQGRWLRAPPAATHPNQFVLCAGRPDLESLRQELYKDPAGGCNLEGADVPRHMQVKVMAGFPHVGGVEEESVLYLQQ